MKPINIEMSAFGPYKDKMEIDFTKLGESGIFLITGDTGAGKTTIFDGIMYALFGEVSGSNRQVTTIRSDFAKDEVETYVVLEFIHKGKTYKIRRNPQYERPKKSGDGFTKNLADASIEYEDEVVSGINNVNEKVEQILGINAKQFKQIAMLAQGEFLKILFAESKDRTEIFRKIFDTNIYNNITNTLKNKLRENSDKLASLKNSFVTNANNIVWEEEKEIRVAGEKDLNPIDVKEIMEKLAEDIEVKKKTEETIDKQVEIEEKELKNIEENLKKIEEQNKKIDTYNNLVKEEKELKEKEEVFIKLQKRIDVNQKIREKVAPIETTIKNLKTEIENLNKNLANEKINNEKLVKLDLESKKNEEKFKDLKVQIDNYNILNNEIKEQKEVIVKVEKIEAAILKKNKFVITYEVFNKEYQELVKNYLKEEDKFFKEQAGILAEKLEVNKPCPVCGSIEHPHIAKKTDEVLSKEELDKLKEEKENKQEKNEELKNTITKLNSEIETLLKSLANYDENNGINEYAIEVKKAYEEKVAKLNETKKTIENIYMDIAKKRIDIEKFVFDEFKNEFDSKRKEQLENITKSNTLLIEYEKNVALKQSEYNKEEKAYEKVIIELGFTNKEEYISSIINDKDVEKYLKEIKEYNIKVVETKTKLEEISKVLKIKEKVDDSAIKEQMEEKRKNLKAVRDKQIKIKGNLQNNKNIKSLLQTNSEKLMKQIDIYLNYEELYRTASGTLPKKRRIEFEQYVQATYFDMILIEANKRLLKMTDNRYLLIRKEASDKIKEKIGLDLDVIDNYNGKKRDVKSLSGGESFKAALSLSLGVSDVIQSYSGGVSIDTLFIDEGFGSLDTESREQAINTLNLLTDNDKLIGIISHVTELKERIERKIIVEKTADGSKVSLY